VLLKKIQDSKIKFDYSGFSNQVFKFQPNTKQRKIGGENEFRKNKGKETVDNISWIF
jgi:hypothetical protein